MLSMKSFNVLSAVQDVLPEIIEKSGLRNVDEIRRYLIEESYQFLPLPVRLIVKEDFYVKCLRESDAKISELILAMI